jgi:hypothetical protein
LLPEAAVRLVASSTYQGAQRWRLILDEKTSADRRSPQLQVPNESVNVVNVGECSDSNIHGA